MYEFYDENENKYPGFHKKKTPNGLCIPCCYSNWSTNEMKNRRDICQGKFDEKTAEPVSEKEKKISLSALTKHKNNKIQWSLIFLICIKYITISVQVLFWEKTVRT